MGAEYTTNKQIFDAKIIFPLYHWPRGGSPVNMSSTEYQLNDGNSIPSIGFGSAYTPGAELIRRVALAIKAGFRYFDTAQGWPLPPCDSPHRYVHSHPLAQEKPTQMNLNSEKPSANPSSRDPSFSLAPSGRIIW